MEAAAVRKALDQQLSDVDDAQLTDVDRVADAGGMGPALHIVVAGHLFGDSFPATWSRDGVWSGNRR